MPKAWYGLKICSHFDNKASQPVTCLQSMADKSLRRFARTRFPKTVQFLEEDRIENFLDDNDFVFMIHQGYMFWYFKADGNPDPIVHGYHENKLKPDILGHLAEFIKEYFS